MAVTPRARGLLQLAGFVVVLLGAALVVRATPLREYVTCERVQALGAAARAAWWSPLAFVAVYALACALDFSGLVLTLAGGAIFGFWGGAVLNLIGANLGASAAFLVARRLGREGLAGLLGGRLGALDRLAQTGGFAWLVRLRLIPIVPFNLLNFAAGLTALPWRTYAAATALGVVPATLVYTYFAAALPAGCEQASGRAFGRVLVAGALLVLLSFVPTIARRLGWLAGVLVIAIAPGRGAAQATLAAPAAPAPQAAPALPDHAAFSAILRDHVQNGRVDYVALRRDSSRLRAYLDQLAAADAAALAVADRNPRIAFWIDAYNACMLAWVIRHYPVRRLSGRAFRDRHCRVAGEVRSQDDIEHRILRPMGDPRIHFAVNCAARSCPVLAREAYVAERLDQQLDAAVQRFVDDPAQFRLVVEPRPVLSVNKILDWYGGDFGGTEGIKRFFFHYLLGYAAATVVRPDLELRFFDYDWTLNDVDR